MAKILVIEDVVDSAKLAHKILTKHGHEVLVAADGEETIGLVTQHTDFDLVLMDLGLPDVDGQTLVGMLRRQYDMADSLIIVVTAWPEKEAKAMADAYGFNDYLSKPYKVNNLLDLVNQHIS